MNPKKQFFMKRNCSICSLSIAHLLIFILVFSSVQAENVITPGTSLKVMAGTSLVSVDNLVVKTGATLDNSGTIILKKDLTNENASPNPIGSGTAELSGAINQTITGQNVIANLTLNNAAGVTIGGNTTVNGNLILTNGRVTLGANNLVLGPSAVIIGTPSASMMIIVTGSGELRKEFPVGYSGAFTYPVGGVSGTPEYSPVTLSFTGGTFAPGNYVGVSLANTVYPDPNITGNYLNRYWNLSQSRITGLLCNASFQYLPIDVTGDENLISCTKVNPLPWTTYGLTNAGSHVLTAIGITSFSSFTGVKSSTPPENQQLANVTIPAGITNCYDATQILTVAGSGTTFLVENNGNVTLVAGSKITMLYGTKVNSGGYLLGRITTTSNFCGTSLNPLVASLQNEQALGVESLVKNQFIKVYPNPTTDIVIVELVEAGLATVANITVYSMQGGKLYQKDLNGESKYQFSLSGKPVGIYMVRVQAGDKSEIAKVVKK